MGGTFDPIHLGHLRAAETAREELGLDRVSFVPARTPPHRPGPLSSPLDRFAMVALATAGNPRFEASDLELRRDGPSYTVDTVIALREERPEDEVVVIVGSDTFPEMATWKDPERLFALCTVAVVVRPGQAGEAAPAPRSRGRVEEVAGPSLAVSSTEIRQRVREGRSIRYLVPEAVADYIAKQGLYR
jgi:nicotinate-nucleotide adenylyltransferase